MKHKKERARELLEELLTITNASEQVLLIGLLEGLLYSLSNPLKDES